MKWASRKATPPEVSCQKTGVQKQTGPFNERPLCFARDERTRAFLLRQRGGFRLVILPVGPLG